MKLKILAVVAIIFMLVGVQISATAYEYNISVPEGYAIATKDGVHSLVAERLGMTTEEVDAFINENEILYFAVSEDLKTQARLSAFTDNFSSAVNDIAYLDSVKLEEFKTALCGESEGEILKLQDRLFIVSAKTLNDSGGDYTVTQYITLCGGKTYYLSCYNDGEGTSDEVMKIVESFSLSEIQESNNSFFITSRIIIFAGIALFSIIAVVMTVGIIKLARAKDDAGNE